MEYAQLQSVKSEYVMMGQYFGRAITDTTLKAYADDLADLSYDEVLSAMRRLRTQPGRRTMPLPGDVREACTTTAKGDVQSQATDIAGRIAAAIPRYGYTNPAAARAYIGDLGWQVTERMGGWANICNTLESKNTGTFNAQCREMARSMLILGALPQELPQLQAQNSNAPRGEMASLGALLQNAVARAG